MLVSIVIVIFNGERYVSKCLDSIINRNKNINFEIIIVDNNSSDKTVEIIKSKGLNNLKIILNKENLGMAARNQGIEESKGDFILMLDVDTEFVSENILKNLIQFLSIETNVGIIGVKMVFPNGTLQYSCRRFPSVFTVIFIRLDKYKLFRKTKLYNDHVMTNYDHTSIKEVDYVLGAFQFIRKKVLEETNGYDNKIFYGPDDLDICLNARKKGWIVIYYPELQILHYQQRITKSNIFSKIFFKHIESLVYYFFKHRYIMYPKTIVSKLLSK